MRYDKFAEILSESITSDGYGGETKSYTVVGTIKCIITPALIKSTDNNYATESKTQWKVITTDTISVNSFQIQSEGKIYKVVEDKPYARNRRVLVCEEVL